MLCVLPPGMSTVVPWKSGWQPASQCAFACFCGIMTTCLRIGVGFDPTFLAKFRLATYQSDTD